MQDLDESSPVIIRARSAATHHSSAWGLGALLISGLLIIALPFSLFQVERFHEFRDGDRWQFITIVYILVYGFFGLACLAILFALIGCLSGLIRGQPLGLPVAGLFVSLVAAALWLLLVLAFTTSRDRRGRGDFLELHHPTQLAVSQDSSEPRHRIWCHS